MSHISKKLLSAALLTFALGAKPVLAETETLVGPVSIASVPYVDNMIDANDIKIQAAQTTAQQALEKAEGNVNPDRISSTGANAGMVLQINENATAVWGQVTDAGLDPSAAAAIPIGSASSDEFGQMWIGE